MKDQIVEMLSNGIAAVNVAAALGLSESYVSQVLAEEGISEQVAANRAARFSDAVSRDNLLNKAEERALQKLEGMVQFITKPLEAAKVFSVLNNAKRSVPSAAPTNPVGGGVVALQLPKAAQVTFVLSSDRQVVEIEGRSMVTMPARNLLRNLEERKVARQLTMEIPEVLPLIAPDPVRSETLVERL